jgi:hypothetical protein
MKSNVAWNCKAAALYVLKSLAPLMPGDAWQINKDNSNDILRHTPIV